MYTIVMDENKTLTTTQRTSLYQGENFVDKIRVLIPVKYGDLDLSEFDLKLIYVDSDNVMHSEKLVLSDKPYNSTMLCYCMPVDSKLTKYAGKLKIRIMISKNNQSVLYTSETSVTINPVPYYCQNLEPDISDIPDAPPMANLSKHAFGSKERIEEAKANGSVDEYDVLFLDNKEIGWVDKNGDTVISTSRTQEAVTVNGVTGLGIENGATIPAGISFDEFVKMVVQKAIPATYTKPTLSLANNGGQASGNVEVGTSITPKLKATFTQNDAGNLTNIVIKRDSTNLAEGTTSPLTYSGEAIVIGDETITFAASATYDDAPVKKNNLGADSTENWFTGGSISSANYSIVGKRNLFYGTGVGKPPAVTSDMVRDLVNKKLAPAQSTSFNVNVEVGQQYIVIAYPSTIRDLNNVTYVEANDSGMAANFTKTIIDVADARGGENGLTGYKVFTYAMAVPAAAPMTFKVTI